MARAVLYAVLSFAILISAHSQMEVPYPRFEFMGSILPNNSYIFRGRIREGSDSLMCVTTYTSCCDDPPIGNWFNHRGELVHQGLDGATTLYVTRGDGVVRLHRIAGGVSGLWRCDIPDENGDLQSLYIFTGTSISGPITDVRLGFSGLHTPSHVSPPVFTLNCTNHGPATTVTWTRNDVMIQEDANHRMTKIILDTHYTTYENTLTVTGREAGVYQCTVRSNRPTRNQNSSNSFTVIEASPPSHVSVLVWTSTGIKVSWQAPPQTLPGNITGYHILYKGEGEASWSREEVEADVTSKIITGLSEGNQTYIVSVVSLSEHLPSDPQLAMVTYGRIYFEIYFGSHSGVFSLNWSQEDASKMERHLLDWLTDNIASQCNCTLPSDMIREGAFYFGPGVSYRGFIGGDETFVQEIATHIETVVRKRRFFSEGKLRLRIHSECPVLLPSLDAEQCSLH